MDRTKRTTDVASASARPHSSRLYLWLIPSEGHIVLKVNTQGQVWCLKQLGRCVTYWAVFSVPDAAGVTGQLWIRSMNTVDIGLLMGRCGLEIRQTWLRNGFHWSTVMYRTDWKSSPPLTVSIENLPLNFMTITHYVPIEPYLTQNYFNAHYITSMRIILITTF
jgi:hypothetical protein